MNPQKETEKAVKRAEKAKKAKAPYAQRMEARARRIEKQQKREDFLYGIGAKWRYQLAVRQLCRLLYRSIRSDYLKQLRLNAMRGLTVRSEWTVSLFRQYYDDELPPSNRFGIHCFPTGFYKREKAKAGRAINRIEHFQKLKTTEASNTLLSDIAEVFNRKHGKTFMVSYEGGECIHIVLEGPHPVTKI
jgi:hypothetical protein